VKSRKEVLKKEAFTGIVGIMKHNETEPMNSITRKMGKRCEQTK
jgi:hypothetical protein